MRRTLFVAIVGLALAALAGCNDPSILASITVSEVDLTKVGDGLYRGTYAISIPAGSLVGQPAAVVDVKVAKNRFESIQILTPSEWWVTNAETKLASLVERILAEQKLNVDVTGGASYTKKAVQKAIENAFAAYLIR
jgi:uncharacterized protein with FMN-binding domain